MSSSHRYSLLAVFIAFFFCVSGFGQQGFSVKFRFRGSMIVVPVTINGAGPYDFILDTGTSDMVVDSQLVAELSLPSAGDINFVTAERSSVVRVVRLDSVEMGGGMARNIKSGVIQQLPWKVRGVLGESFLKSFDLLIDNRRRVVEFESGPWPLADQLAGERVPFLAHGMRQGKPTPKRIVVFARFFELGDREFRLQLDSGTEMLLMFTRLGDRSRPRDSVTVTAQGASAGTAMDELSSRLQVGQTNVQRVSVVAPLTIPQADVDGFLPTSLFDSVFISHSGEFLILNPKVKRQMAQLKP
jgi:predicted aspartyl protease